MDEFKSPKDHNNFPADSADKYVLRSHQQGSKPHLDSHEISHD